MSESPPLIEIKNLSKTYSVGGETTYALKEVNINIREGEVFGFIGQSGAGKSSLARCIASLEPITGGQVLVGGVDLNTLRGEQLRFYRRKLGLVFQHFNLLMNSTVYDNIAFPLKVAGKPKAYTQSQVNKLLELVGLQDKRNSYPAQLSGGQKQRVGIARALAAEPSIVICDEATSALDPSTTESIMQLIKQINSQLGITFVIITHEMEVIKQVCSRVAILEDGRVIEEGSVLDVCARPQTDTARRFFKVVDTELTNPAYKNALSKGGLLVKVTFLGEASADPFMSECVKRFGVTVSVLSGNIQEIGTDLMGCLVIKLDGSEEGVNSAIEYLRDHKVLTEVLNIGQNGS